ncbi:serine/threonine-protein phosphatase 4 regulatory subunit 4 isoform X2 [Anoplophora glabripennis]|uniref:serine/threonine-protein phosphatase 4 regulatory subunit 4 isoform X2 n=1 Tax=Anoplophora glabripennis TaxID=217634 RepID=UPI00087497AE|nr:serine/threonine-protein phosphatase 4 regulatory subunit 4 isoform X2 [Anoplophora glabripennis]
MNSSVVTEANDPHLIWQDLYMKGDDLQKMSVIQALPSLLQSDNNGTITRILPKIQQELPTSSSEFHLVTSKIFRNLIQMNLSVNLLRPVLQGIESKDPLVSNAWIETLLSVILNLSDTSIKREVLPFAVTMSQLNKSASYRIASCKMLGQIAIHPRLSAFDVKKDILPIAQGLCQDCYHEVRTAMCYELSNIAKGLGSDNLVKSSLLPSLVELSSDENVSVRAASVDAAVLVIPYLNQDTIKQTIIPLIKQLCGASLKSSDLTFSAIARVYGMLLNNLQNHVTPSESQWFLNYFMQLSKKGLSNTPEELELDPGLDVTCREQCAYNLPAVTNFMVTKIVAEMNTWYQVFKSLAADPCYLVRKTVAGGIHEVAKILGNDCKIIMMDFVKLLRDDSEEVLDSLVPNVATTLECLCGAGVLSREAVAPGTLEISRALLKCQADIFRYHNWRRKMTFLQQLECLPNVIESDFIHQHFTSVILKLTINARARPVRSQASRTILVLLRYNLKENHRKWIREKLISLLYNSPCCYTRHIFINMCIHAIEIFSNKYFKEHFFLPLVKLIEDPVSTIRLSVVNISPMLKRMCLSAVDRNYQVKLESALAKIEVVESDKDVIMCVKAKLKEMRVPQISKPDVLMEEKRRTEEEDRIMQGKLPPPKFTYASTHPLKDPGKPLVVSKSATITTKRISASSPATTSEMSFLGHHFYIDAGVALPEKINEDHVTVEDKMKSLELDIPRQAERFSGSVKDEIGVPTVSLENTNVENMSDDDLKELETSTTNITDDVKANIQKKSLSNLTPTDPVKKRTKRYSSVFPTDQQTTNNIFLKRRSLNIGLSELSKIPVSSKYVWKSDEKTNLKRSKSSSIQSFYSSSSKTSGLERKSNISRLKWPLNAEGGVASCSVGNVEKFVDNGNVAVDHNDSYEMENIGDGGGVEVKENVPLTSDGVRVNVPNRCNRDNVAKVSNLPVLVRRTQSEVRK